MTNHHLDHTPTRRTDTDLSRAINRGLAVAILANLQSAIDLMRAENVPTPIIARVLNKDQQRWSTDWK
ncbi:hypothetical protein [Sapientia aquatica]|uniref:Uncharacterized protein n=1 Tax=Sapientia aquatica TaxID=1549640 RepID=A0A4R5W1I2_9BURK|nr:hypothetical protein [Sapientia aquatica]TDK65985.1 hypothetical protein E2I14_10345 [Sapientia aquatica]